MPYMFAEEVRVRGERGVRGRYECDHVLDGPVGGRGGRGRRGRRRRLGAHARRLALHSLATACRFLLLLY